MGCDYYTWIETVIDYKDLSGKRREYIERPDFEEYERNYEYSSGSYDTDLEDPPENSLEIKKKWYGEKVLFENGSWKCKEAGKQRVQKLLEEQKISLESVVRIFKRMDGYWR